MQKPGHEEWSKMHGGVWAPTQIVSVVLRYGTEIPTGHHQRCGAVVTTASQYISAAPKQHRLWFQGDHIRRHWCNTCRVCSVVVLQRVCEDGLRVRIRGCWCCRASKIKRAFLGAKISNCARLAILRIRAPTPKTTRHEATVCVDTL